MIHEFDLQQLAGTHQIPRHFDVLLAGRGVAAGMIMLWEAWAYVRWTSMEVGMGLVCCSEAARGLHIRLQFRQPGQEVVVASP